MKKNKLNLIGKELQNSSEALKWNPSMAMELQNAAGDVSESSLGYQYTTQTTTQIRAKVIEQKFYKIAPAEYMPVVVGTGAWLEDIKTNLTYDVAGDFESGYISTASAPAQLSQVDVGTAPITAKIWTWAKGYIYTMPEVQKALASNNWDVVAGKMAALKRNWDLGIQRIAFLGRKGDLTNTPGLYTNSTVTINTSRITAMISGMSTANFQTIVKNLIRDFMANCSYTATPNTFIMPLDDFLGMTTAASADFPVNSKLEFLTNAFRMATGNANFQVKGLAYGNQAQNAGWINSATGKYRYILYNNEADTLCMDIPVDFNLLPAGTRNNFQFEGIGAGQHTGCIFYRPAEALYYDHTSST